jgi:hypothetical protein
VGGDHIPAPGPSGSEALWIRAEAATRARLTSGQPVTAAWLGEAARLTNGGALKWLREQAAAGHLTRGPRAGAPAPYRDEYVRAQAQTKDQPIRVLVTGSRHWSDQTLIVDALNALHRQHGRQLILVHGACRRGADQIADSWAMAHGVPTETHPADWSTGHGAGPARNAAMVATRPDACLAFILNDSPGASGCARDAERAGIPTTRYVRRTPPARPRNGHVGRSPLPASGTLW